MKLDCRGFGKDHKFFNLPKYFIAVARDILNTVLCKCQDIVVDIATRYGLDGPGFESRWGRHFRDRYRCPSSLLYVEYRVYPMGKAARSWCWQLPHSSAEVGMGRSYTTASPLCLHRHVMGWFLEVNVKVKVTLQQATKSQRGVEVQLCSFLNLGARCGWLTPRPGRLTPGKETQYPLYRRLGGLQGRSGQLLGLSLLLLCMYIYTQTHIYVYIQAYVICYMKNRVGIFTLM